jgi:uncharacterized protein (DUF1501 family)
MKTHTFLNAPALSRRRWLQLAGGTLAGALGAGTLTALAPRLAQAQSGYKALVCVFLYGGNDGMNMVVPSDLSRHNQYAGVRGELALPRGSLVPLAGTDYGLHPAMGALSTAWADGALAPVFNLGPLRAPMSKAEYLAAAATALPDNLFSHSDQQLLWESGGGSSIARTGWGGRAAATLGTVNPVISVGGNGHFGLSELSSPLVLPGPGSTFGLEGYGSSWAPITARESALDALYAQAQSETLPEAFARQQRDAFGIADRLGPLVSIQPGNASVAQIDSAFAPLISGTSLTTPLARQLYQIAKLVQENGTVQGSRQLFFASQGGYDTHGGQIASNALDGPHYRLLEDLAASMACFHQAMKNLGLQDSVTLFTQSDFGRTFAPNSSAGTDHAWGNHQLVLGGAVNGAATYGTYPELVLGGPNDVGVYAWELQGRWIPGHSVDQYAATLLRWLGASEGQLDSILPNLANFGSARNLGFMSA